MKKKTEDKEKRSLDRKWKKKEKRLRGMESSNKRKGGKCQGILRKSSQWCKWDMKGKRRVRKKKKK